MDTKNPLAVLGVISVIAIVGMIFLFTGAISGAFVTITPEQACARGVMCQYGEGALPVGVENGYAQCVCPDDVIPETMAEATNFKRTPGYYHESKVRQISLTRKY